MAPVNGDAVPVALVDVSTDGVAETLAVATAVTRTAVLDAL